MFCVPREDQPPKWYVEELDVLELANIRGTLEALRGQLVALLQQDGDLDYFEGEHCRYCPMQNRCPAKISAIQAFAFGAPSNETKDDPITLALAKAEGDVSITVVTEVVRKILQYDAARAVIWKQIEKIAKKTPIDLGDGRRLMMAPARASDKVQDAKAVLDFLADRYGDDVARGAATTTKAAIEEAAATVARATGKAVGKAKEEVVEQLRAAGLIVKAPGKTDVRVVESSDVTP